MATTIQTWLNFALQQMAAEAYLDQFYMVMHTFSRSLVFVAGLLVVVPFACSRETPVEKVKAPATSGNAVTEAVGQAAVDLIKTPMDKARQTEGTLERSAEQRGAESEKSTQ